MIFSVNWACILDKGVYIGLAVYLWINYLNQVESLDGFRNLSCISATFAKSLETSAGAALLSTNVVYHFKFNYAQP